VSAFGAARVSETAERFLRAIAERLGAERIIEVHLFPPLRQGPLESAVAVVVVDDGAPAPADDVVDPARSEPRHAIYTAAYRFTRKGRERGAWAVEIVVRADAPLDAVAAVVRGVQRRSDGACAGLQLASGDAWSDPDRLSGADFRAIVVGVGTDPLGAPAVRDAAPREASPPPRPATDDISGRVDAA
jgi:hypothetical protein